MENSLRLSEPMITATLVDEDPVRDGDDDDIPESRPLSNLKDQITLSFMNINGEFLENSARESAGEGYRLETRTPNRGGIYKSSLNLGMNPPKRATSRSHFNLSGDVDEIGLDDNYILAVAKESNPQAVTSLDINDRGLKTAKPSSLKPFEKLRDVSANENQLNMDAFECLSSLHSLSLACNSIKEVPILVDKFLMLETLDLSFNRLRNPSMGILSRLPNLRFLNLMNNELTHISKEVLMHMTINEMLEITDTIPGFPKLEILILESNRIDSVNSETLLTLSKFPRLRKLNLNHNLIHTLAAFNPYNSKEQYVHIGGKTIAKTLDGFLKLEELYLAGNLIARRNDLIGIVTFPKLKSVWLQGNPIFKTLITNNKLKEFSELLSEFREVYELKIEDVQQLGNVEVRRGTNVIQRILEMKKKASIKNGIRPAALRTVEDVRIPSPEKLTEGKIMSMLMADNDSLDSLLFRPSTFSTEPSKPATTVAPGKSESNLHLSDLTPMEKATWQMAGVRLDSPKSAGKIPDSSSRYLPEEKSATFLTGLHIENKATMIEDRIMTIKKNRIKKDWEQFDEPAEKDQQWIEVPLPGTIQGTVKALRFAVDNPQYYWRHAHKVADPHGIQLKNNDELAKQLNRNKRDFWELYTLCDKMDDKIERLGKLVETMSTKSPASTQLPKFKTMSHDAKSQMQDLQSLLFAVASKSAPE